MQTPERQEESHLLEFAKPNKPLTHTIASIEERWGAEVAGLLELSGRYYSSGYNRWQLNRTMRIQQGTGFEGYFTWLPLSDAAADDYHLTMGFYADKVLSAHTRLHPHDGRFDRLLRFLNGETAAVDVLPLGFDLFSQARSIMRFVPYHDASLSQKQRIERAMFADKTKRLAAAAPPVEIVDNGDGLIYQKYALPEVKREFTMPYLNRNGATDRDLFLDTIGILGQPAFFLLQQMPPAFFKYIPYGPPKGSKARELLQMFARDQILDAMVSSMQ